MNTDILLRRPVLRSFSEGGGYGGQVAGIANIADNGSGDE
jgi:hypothetical protein